MKKVGIIVLIIILISLVIGLCKVLVFALHHNDWNWFTTVFKGDSNMRKEEYIRKEQKIAIDDIEKINLDFKSSDLNVFFTEDREIRVVQYSYKDLREDEFFQVDKTSSNITISENKKPRFFIFYIGFMENFIYDVYLPKEYIGKLEIKSVSGDIEVKDHLTFKDLKIATTSGDIKMGDVDAKNIQMDTVSGDIKLGQLESDVLALKTVSGDIFVESIEGKTQAKTTSGGIELQKIEGSVELASISGDIKSEDFKILGASKVKTTSGNVKMYLNQEANCEIQTKTVSGNVTLPNRRNVMGEEPYEELSIETVSGNIRLEK
ncbi:MAG: DUF4097 domain-containing protein [Clostridia bacterium]|nr:DUF4097 domain-containing protein [Clostridia bacterium]